MAGKHAKPKQGSKFRRNIAVTSTIAVGGLAIPATFAGTAHAADDLNCSDIGHQVTIVDGNDPFNLDADHDGIGCESYPGPATPLDDAPTAAAEASTDAATAPADYIVKRGDNLSAIARSYGVDLSALEALNPGIIAGDRPDDYSLIFAGGHVHLPVGAHATAGKHARRTHVRVWYASCDDAPVGLHKGQAGYRHALDMDGDGKACEGPWPPASTAPSDPGTGTGSTDPGSDSGTDTGSTDTPPATNPDGTVVPVIAPDAPGTPSGYAAHRVSYWAPLIEQAKSLVGVNYDTGAIEALMTSESGGDPNDINLSDSNAAQGTPSKGLMQVIQPTFDAYHVDGTSTNLYDPLANIAAALNYIKNVYGYVPNSPY